MSWFGLFRGLLGGRDPGEHFSHGMTRDDDEDDDDGDEFSDGRGRDDFSFGPSGRQFDGGFSDLFREMDELFRGVGSWDVPVGHFEVPGIEARPPAGGPEAEGSGRALRDWMLKQPDSGLPGSRGRSGEGEGGSERRPNPRDRPNVGMLSPYRRPWNPSSNFEDTWKSLRQGDTVKEDKDLDSRVNSEGLNNILTPSRAEPKSFFKSVSISKVVLPDGTVEERRTTCDSEGNEETKVTRAHGEQCYTTVTRRGAEGQEVNMDERDRERFAEMWDRREGNNPLDQPQAFLDSLSLLDRLLKGIFSNR